ncbi:MAG: C39 family peptidase [bacterium]
MRIRNYFFLAVSVTLITAIVVYQLEIYLKETGLPNVAPVLVSEDSTSSVMLLASSSTLDSSMALSSTTSASTSSYTSPISSSTPSSSSTSSSILVSTKETEKKPVVPVFKLDVPYYKQQYANSCEAASLRMALAYYGIKISDDLDIVQKFGYNPRDKDVVNNEWDDPQEMFVGNIDIVGSANGYGVYGKPVAKAAIDYGREADYETVITPHLLAKEIKAGYPIILWGYTSLTNPAYTWNLASGGKVTAFKGEHARVVVGFAGNVDDPDGFYVHDPFNGKASEYWTSEKLMDQVYAVPGVTNQVVVVR